MDDFFGLLNKNIRQESDKPSLSRFDFSQRTMDGELLEGLEPGHWFSDHQKGIQIQCDDRFLIKVIFLYAGEYRGEKFQPYPYELGRHLAFDMNRKQVRHVLGEPSVFRDAFESRFLGRSGGWDRYDDDDRALHFQYSAESEKIELITIMSRDGVS